MAIIIAMDEHHFNFIHFFFFDVCKYDLLVYLNIAGRIFFEKMYF